MRTLLLVSALAALAACSDSQQTTAPASSRGRAASGDVAPAGQSTVTPSAKPGSTPAFTTVTQVVSNEIALDAGYAIAGSAVCPVGSTLVGGGFTFVSEGNPNARPFVRESQPLNNGWFVSVANWATGAWYSSFKAYALCAS